MLRERLACVGLSTGLLVNPVFSPARIGQLQTQVERLAADLLDRLLDRSADGVAVDLVADYALPLSVGTLAEFTGLPVGDSPRWVGWIRRMFDVTDRDSGAQASRELGAYVDELIAARKRAPREGDFISLLLDSQVDGHRLTDREIHSFTMVQFGAGFETTADAISVALHYLSEHPEALRMLAAEPALVPSAVEEFLRFASPIQVFGRNATRDLDVRAKRYRCCFP